MVPVALYDTVVVDDAPELTVTHEPQLCVLPERTTTWKAAVLLANKLGISPDVSIDVQVHISREGRSGWIVRRCCCDALSVGSALGC